MIFQRIATVELQLIMHWCDFKTLLALARCSRFTLQAVSDPFAWRCLSPLPLPFMFTSADSNPIVGAGRRQLRASVWQRLRICFGIRPPPPPPPLSASLPLRFCDIAVQWSHARSSSVTAAELDAIAAVPRLRVLDQCCRRTAGPADLESLAKRPGLRGLTALSCAEGQLDETAIRALAECCPCLSALTLWQTEFGAGPDRAAPLPLHLLPALTDLAIVPRRVSQQALLACASRCAGLRRLAVSAKETSAAHVHTVLLSPSLRALEHLSLSELDVRHADGHDQPLAQLDWATAFANLPALQSLWFEDPRATGVRSDCARLQSMRLRFSSLALPGATESDAPSRAALAALLDRLPSLGSVVLSMPTLEEDTLFLSPDELPDRVLGWTRAHERFAALAALAPHRVSVRLK